MKLVFSKFTVSFSVDINVVNGSGDTWKENALVADYT